MRDEEEMTNLILDAGQPKPRTRSCIRLAVPAFVAAVVVFALAIQSSAATVKLLHGNDKDVTMLDEATAGSKRTCWHVSGAHMKGVSAMGDHDISSSDPKIGGHMCEQLCKANARCSQCQFVGWKKKCFMFEEWSEEPIEFNEKQFWSSYCGTKVSAINATIQKIYRKKPNLPVWYDCTWPTDYKNTYKPAIYPGGEKATNLCSKVSKDCGWYQADCSESKCCAKRDFDPDFNWVGQKCVKKKEGWAACMAPGDIPKMKSQGWDGSVLGEFRMSRQIPPAAEGVLLQPTTLFCFSVVMWHMGPSKPGYDAEAALASNWKNQGKGIVQCDGHKIYEGVTAPMEAWGSFSNIDAFLIMWDNVKNDKEYLSYGWTVKVDADAVFFPDRLKGHLNSLRTPQGAAVYLKNTQFKFQFLGALEILSREAVELFLERQAECNGGGGHSGGEDWFMVSCLEGIGVDHQEDFGLLQDIYANPGGSSSCGNKWTVAFHYYKTVGAWNTCWNEAGR